MASSSSSRRFSVGDAQIRVPCQFCRKRLWPSEMKASKYVLPVRKGKEYVYDEVTKYICDECRKARDCMDAIAPREEWEGP